MRGLVSVSVDGKFPGAAVPFPLPDGEGAASFGSSTCGADAFVEARIPAFVLSSLQITHHNARMHSRLAG